MSRVGNKIIKVPEGVNITISDGVLSVAGTKGQLSFAIPEGIEAKFSDGIIRVSRAGETKAMKSLHGTSTRVIGNLIKGVSEGFERKLDYKGVGFTVVVADGQINMRLGFSHPVVLAIPAGIEVNVVKSTIVVSGIDKEQVGAFAAKIRELKKPEVYKGKGIKYHEEIIKKKAGKTAQSASA